MTEATPLTATVAARQLREGSTTSIALVEGCLEAAEAWEPSIHALVRRLDAAALQAAAASDRRFAAGAPLGPLDGIPVAVKDLIDMAGEVTAAGSRVLAHNVAKTDATVVARLRDAGAVLVAKTNTHEFALGALSPPTRNPWDPRRMPGGSSAGSGVAVVTGMALGALGTDTAGSIREPAGLSGLAGLKPTYGRVSRRGVVPLAWSLDCVGPMARTSEDCLALLRIIEGADASDPTSVDAAETTPTPVTPADMRFGVVSDLTDPLQGDVRAAFNGLTRSLSDAGARLEEVSIGDCDETVAAILVILAVEASAYHRRWLDTIPDLYEPDVLRYLRVGERVRAVDFVDAQRYRRVVWARVNGLFERFDALLTPGQLVVAPLVSDDRAVFPGGVERPRDLTLVRPLTPFSLTGHPAAIVPLGRGVGGLPVSAQIVGAPFRDAWLLQVAARLETLAGRAIEVPTLPAPAVST